MSEHISHIKTYVIVYIALMILMGSSAFISRIPLGHLDTAAVLTIAAIKASLVLLFFMHLRYENYTLISVVFVAGLFWLLIFFGLTLIDYGSRHVLGVPGH